MTNDTTPELDAIHRLADTYDIRLGNAARVYAGDANASVERGYFHGLPDGVN